MTKQPMMDLFKRGRSAGLGMMLATQNPGDLDYACRDEVLNWAIGKISSDTAVNKLKPVYGEQSQLAKGFSKQKQGQFVVAQNGRAQQFKGHLSLVVPEQLDEAELIQAARGQLSSRRSDDSS
jgi:hypothetical protein